MESYCHHCIDARASKLVYVNGRDHWLCASCAAHYLKKKKLPDIVMSAPIACFQGHARPPLLEEMERYMGGDGSRTLKIPIPRG